jgi:EAL domain-containing protein (putative c-di-GMP-specific phosphodiesterase class I)
MCFEITETAAIANLGNVVYFMRELKARGCHFALDDFGSGLSSFMYLKTLPVDYLKIDGQFIENVTRDPVDRSMVEAISQVGRAMGIQTIAERVESAEVLAELGRFGDWLHAQGFHMRGACLPFVTGALLPSPPARPRTSLPSRASSRDARDARKRESTTRERAGGPSSSTCRRTGTALCKCGSLAPAARPPRGLPRNR